MRFFVVSHHRVWITGIKFHEPGAVALEWLVTGAITVNIFPRGSIGIGKLIGCDANNWSILVVECLQSPVYVTTVYCNHVWKPVSGPEKWSGIVSKRMNERIVDPE